MGQRRILRAAGLLVVAVACLALLGAGGDTDTAEHRSYPASHLFLIEEGSEQWQDVVPMLRARLREELARYASRMTREERQGARAATVGSSGPKIDGLAWYRVESHPVFLEVVPGMQLYLGFGGTGETDLRWDEDLLAVVDSTVYRLPAELNHLLSDAGVLPGKSYVDDWARMAALLWCGDFRSELAYCLGLGLGDDGWFQPYFPPVTFEHIELDTTNYFGQSRVGMRVWGQDFPIEVETRPRLLEDGSRGLVPVRVLGIEQMTHYWIMFSQW